MKTIAIAIVAVSTFISSTVLLAEPKHTTDSLETVQENLEAKKALLVDVREEKEWKEGHIDGSMLVPLSMLEKVGSDEAFLKALGEVLAQQIPTDRIIYAHCGSGVRSAKASVILKKLGYDVRPLKAGYDELVEAGFPSAKPTE